MIRWTDVAPFLIEINRATRLRLLVYVATCFGADIATLVRPTERAPATNADRAQGFDQGFLAAFASAAEGVEVNFRWRPQLTDPNDELVLEAGVNGGADALVTHNVRDFRMAAPRFGLRVLPRELLKELEP